MAFSVKKKGGPVAEINVTPLVDVMLVLLVIFMITAPLMLNGIKLNLPKTKETNPVSLTTQQVILSMSRSNELFLGKDKILLAELVPEIRAQFKDTKTDTLFLRADNMLKYGDVARIMSHLRRSGISKIALVTETEK